MATKKVVVQKPTQVDVSNEYQPYIEPQSYFSGLSSGSIYTAQRNTSAAGTSISIQIIDPNFYLRFGYGKWRKYGYDHATQKFLYAWDEYPKPAWLTVSGSDAGLSMSYPARTPVEVEIPDVGNDDYYIQQEERWPTGTTVTIWVFRKGENYTPPPFPYDPNNPTPPQPPSQGELKLWCKVGGEVHKAKQAYIKQNGILIPVKKILGR